MEHEDHAEHREGWDQIEVILRLDLSRHIQDVPERLVKHDDGPDDEADCKRSIVPI
jgi:hypothetical protein